MAQGKQTPRQKMINLMYLVFIAMLAMNIDQEIIRSYYESTVSLKETRLSTENKNSKIFEKTLEAKAQQVPDTYASPWEQYKVLREKINDLVNYAEKSKKSLKDESQFIEKDLKTGKLVDIRDNFSALNNTEASTSYFFLNGDESKPSQNANSLKAKIDEVRNYINVTFKGNPQMQGLIDHANKAMISEFQQKVDNKSWLQYKFYNQPLIASISNLEILQNDARNVQSDALAMMLQEKVDASIKFSSYEPVISAPSDIQSGKKGEAIIMLGTYSNSNKINISGVSRQENGKGYIALNTSGLGEHKIGGNITLMDASGKAKNFPWTHTYNVIAGPQEVKLEKGLLLSADKMNVMYRGLENPVSGSILGADNSKLSLSAPGAVVKGTGPGKWIVTPTTGNTVQLTLSGKDPRGQNVSQVFEYRIKPVPPPQGQMRGVNVLTMPASSVPNQTVQATIPDFDFPVSFTVNQFMVKVPGRAALLIKGNSLSDAAGLMKNVRAGESVFIFDIKATASGLGNQQIKNISSILINVQ